MQRSRKGPKVLRTDRKIVAAPLELVDIPVHERVYSLEEYDVIQLGFLPREMEDKWFLFSEGDVLHCHRSWTGKCVYQVCFDVEAYEARVVKVRCNPEFATIDDEHQEAYHRSMALFLIDNILLGLGTEFPVDPDVHIGSSLEYWMHRHGVVGSHFPPGTPSNQKAGSRERQKQYRPTPIDVAEGCILGAFVGDAAGATLEFTEGAPEFERVTGAINMLGRGPHRIAPGQITDDGEMALSLMHALVGANTFDIERVAASYLEWYSSKPFDIGGTTTVGILGGRGKPPGEIHEGMWAMAAERNMDSKANGSLMRIAPLGIWGYKHPEDSVVEWAKQDSRLTHSNGTCQAACGVYCTALRHLMLQPGDAKAAFDAAKQRAEILGNQEVVDWLTDSEQRIDIGYAPMIGFVRYGFTHAFRHLIAESPYEFALIETLKGGGDTDTNACIVGAMLGALHGIERLPKKMVQTVLECDTTKGRPRPEFLQTRVQLPSLIHRLVE